MYQVTILDEEDGVFFRAEVTRDYAYLIAEEIDHWEQHLEELEGLEDS